MRDIKKIRQNIGEDIFNYVEIIDALKNYSQLRDVINNLLRKKDIIRVKNAKYGLAQNMGGSGASCVINILEAL